MLDLFHPEHDASKNHLPYDGAVHYWGPIYNGAIASGYFECLMADIPWKNDEALVFGKHIVTARKYAWFADKEYEYTYSNIHRTARLWTPLLLELKAVVEQYTKQEYNACLLNLYHNGEEAMGWHSDDEKDLKFNGSIASLSFGATRKFVLKHKTTKHKVALELHRGDLLEMKGATQTHWVHRITPSKKVHGARINLTFRQMLA